MILSFVLSAVAVLITAGCTHPAAAPAPSSPAPAAVQDSRNLLVNSGFNFHPYMPHRTGSNVNFIADYVPFWNADTAASVRVFRIAHIPKNIRPAFAVPNGVQIKAGQSFKQFFTLPEADLIPGDAVSLKFYGWQQTPGALQGELRVMKIESEDGQWSPQKDFGFKDRRTFQKMSRGELVVAKSAMAQNSIVNKCSEYTISGLVIPGHFTPGRKSYSKDCNTVGIELRFTNVSSKPVWLFAPSLVRGSTPLRAVGEFRKIPEYYRHIPRTMQKLWKGEAIHIIVMGSSIDRGSGNPRLYAYNEDPKSPKFKQPLSDVEDGFSTALVGRPDLDPYFGRSSHYFTYAGRLKVELMKKFNLSGDKILLNFMARDGSCVGEAHSGLKTYCELLIPPSPNGNGHKAGKTWQELYPELFSRAEGPRPDLIIYGSGANEKTDKPDECAVFEGAIRYIQRNYPGTEFIGCMYQNHKGYTPNGSDMQAIAMRYGIPFIDFGIVNDRLTAHINHRVIGNHDGHPQAAIHYIWFKQLEKAFECPGPVVAGFPQTQLPERIMPTTINWEGEMKRYMGSDPRFFRPGAMILDDGAFNCWVHHTGKKSDKGIFDIYVDGKVKQKYWKHPAGIDVRNSYFRFGRLSFGDRHVVELFKGMSFRAVDAKQLLNRTYTGVESPRFSGSVKAQPYKSQTGFPYGKYITILKPGQSCSVTLPGTAFAAAWVDSAGGGELKVEIDGKVQKVLPTDQPLTLAGSKEKLFVENRKGFSSFAYGMHTVKFTALKKPVKLMGVYSYDLRANRSSERVVRSILHAGETMTFVPAFKAIPVINLPANLKIKSLTREKAVIGGQGSGYIEAIGE